MCTYLLRLSQPRVCAHNIVSFSAIQGWYDLAKKTTQGTFTQYFVLPYKFVAKVRRPIVHTSRRSTGLFIDRFERQLPASTSFNEAATIPTGVATSAFPLYNQDPAAASARLTAPWLEGGRGKYSGKPFLLLGGASSMGQFGSCSLLVARVGGSLIV